MADIIYINVEEGVKRVMNNTKLFSKLLVKFKDDIHLSEIETALKDGNNDKAKDAAHTLKGLAANLSLTELYKQVAELEAQIKTGNIGADQVARVKDAYAITLKEADEVIAKYA